MKWGGKLYLGSVVFVAFVSLLIIFLYYFMPPFPINSHTEYAYVPNGRSDNLSVINTTTNDIEYNIDVGNDPEGVAITPDGRKVYVTNSYLNTVSVINTATNKVVAKVPVGRNPIGIAVSPDGKKVYVANEYTNNVSVIDTTIDIVTDHLTVETNPFGVAVTPDGKKVYVTNLGSGTISVIDTTNYSVLEPINVGPSPYGVAVNKNGKVYITHSDSNKISVIDTTKKNISVEDVYIGNAKGSVELSPLGVVVSPDGKYVYVANHKKRIQGTSDTPRGSVSIINTTTNNVIASVTVGKCPCGISINGNGTKVYVANSESNTISVIDTISNNEIANVPVGSMPSALGQFIGSPPKVPKHSAIQEFISSVVESVYRIYNIVNERINGVQGYILGILTFFSKKIFSIFDNMLSDFISPIIKEKLEPVRKRLDSLLNKIFKKK
jgi:YVTN family beta-propeller protein